MYIQCTSPGDGQTSCNVWLASGDRRRWSNEGKTRNRLKFAGVLQTGKPISAVSGPKFAILWDMWGRYYCLTGFSGCRYMPQLRRYSPTKLCDGAQMAIFASFLHPVFPAKRVQHISDLYSEFKGHTMCRSMVDIQSAAAEIMRVKNQKKKKKSNHSCKI